MDITERIQTRIAELKTARQKLVDDTNRQIDLMSVAIGELEAIINPPAEPPAGSLTVDPLTAETRAELIAAASAERK